MTAPPKPTSYIQMKIHHCITCGLIASDQVTLELHLEHDKNYGHEAGAKVHVRVHAVPEDGLQITYSSDAMEFLPLARLPAGPATWTQPATWSPDDGETGELATRQTRFVSLQVACHPSPHGVDQDHWQQALDYFLEDNDAYELLSNEAGGYFHELNDHVLTGTGFKFEPGRHNADGLLSFQGRATRYRAHEDIQGSITTFDQDEDIVEQIRLDITLGRDPDGLLLGRMLENEGYTQHV